MAAEPDARYKVNIVIQDTTAQTKQFTDPDNLVINKATGETLAQRLQGIDIINDNLEVIVDKINETADSFASVKPTVSVSSVNGNILINDIETPVYTPDRSVIRYSDVLPTDTSPGEIYMVLLDENKGE